MAHLDNSAALPVHIGFIVDGNRRWAKSRSLPTRAGHEHAIKVLKQMAYAAQARDIKYISAYIFSTENWNRTKEEVGYLMDLFLQYFAKDMKQLVKDGFRIVFLGRPNGVRAKIREAIAKTEEDSRNNTGTTLALCFNYGGQAEIVDASREIAEKVARKELKTDDITEETFAKFLYHPEIPPLDMMVRSSGEQRLSGFMLWRAAYAELMWIDKMWPDMTEKDLDNVLAEFAKRSRRFGK